MLVFVLLHPDILPEAIEVTTTSEVPKIKERRRKRKQEIQEITVEATPAEGSPDKSTSKRRKRSHKDSKPNIAHSCVGDNVSKVIIESNLVR